MFYKYADNLEFLDARVVGWVIDIERDELKDFIPVRVIPTWSVFLEGRFHLIRLLAQPRRDDEVAGVWRERRVDDDDVVLAENGLHRRTGDLQGEAFVRQLFVDPDEVATVKSGLSRLDLPDARRRSCLNVGKNGDPLHVAAHRFDVTRDLWLTSMVRDQRLAISIDKPIHCHRKLLANLYCGFGLQKFRAPVDPIRNRGLLHAGNASQACLRQVELLHQPTDTFGKSIHDS